LLKVIVKDNKIEYALRKLKKKVKDSGMMIELREREFYTKPSVKKREMRKRAKINNRKLSNNQ
jgi:small subunit ribosomal protein S21|tara:strand:+ start:173 stop:361 length:189 start_codon:yes stop_codon:yes gene_type:complete